MKIHPRLASLSHEVRSRRGRPRVVMEQDRYGQDVATISFEIREAVIEWRVRRGVGVRAGGLFEPGLEDDVHESQATEPGDGSGEATGAG